MGSRPPSVPHLHPSRKLTGVPRSYKNVPPQDPTVALCLGPYGGPRGVGCLLSVRCPCSTACVRLGSPWKPLEQTLQSKLATETPLWHRFTQADQRSLVPRRFKLYSYSLEPFGAPYKGTSLRRNRPPLGPYSGICPGPYGVPSGGGVFF